MWPSSLSLDALTMASSRGVELKMTICSQSYAVDEELYPLSSEKGRDDASTCMSRLYLNAELRSASPPRCAEDQDARGSNTSASLVAVAVLC